MRVAKHLALTLAIALAACAAPTFHKAYEEAHVVGISPPQKGVILYLHGCNGLHPGNAASIWFAHLQSLGFLIIAPDSFADPRPGELCGWHLDRASGPIQKIRQRQAEVALQRIRAAYPDAPLFVWGHSEGGGVALALDDAFDGVLVTGDDCGWGSERPINLPESTPVLVVVGTRDSYFSREVLQRHCGKLKRSPLWRFEMVDGGHIPSFHMNEFRQPIERFFTEPAARQAKAP